MIAHPQPALSMRGLVPISVFPPTLNHTEADMKSGSLAIAAALGMVLGGAATASTIEFYDDPVGAPLLIGGDGLTSVLIDIDTNLTSLAGYTAALELRLSDDEGQPNGEGAVVADLNNHKINVDQGTTPAWYVWGGNVASLLTAGTNELLSLSGVLTFSEELTSHPPGKDFLYYNARLVFSVVPEASQWLLLGAGLLATARLARRSRLSH
jgi:hypothetical protein